MVIPTLLRANFPADIMGYDETPIDSEKAATLEHRSASSFLTSHEVLAYLEERADPIKHLIQVSAYFSSIYLVL